MGDKELLRALKALADPKRFRMVQDVSAAGELSCGQIAEAFPLSQPTISHHLKILTDAGILVVRQEAKHHFISVDQALVGRVAELVKARLSPSANGERPRRKVATE
jgi:ArsR family transcriptional regulator